MRRSRQIELCTVPPGDDPWSMRDPWQNARQLAEGAAKEWRSAGSSDPWAFWHPQPREFPSHRQHVHGLPERSRAPALVTTRGATTIIHDAQLAREFLAPLQSVLVANAQLSVTTSNNKVIAASAAGHGWRSKLVAKKLARAAQQEPQRAEEPAHRELDEDEEVRLRIAAAEPGIRAQVQEQICGKPCRTTSGLIDPDLHVVYGAARHHFQPGQSFECITPEVARRSQRGARGRSPVPMTEEHAKLKATIAVQAICRADAEATGSELNDKKQKKEEERRGRERGCPLLGTSPYFALPSVGPVLRPPAPVAVGQGSIKDNTAIPESIACKQNSLETDFTATPTEPDAIVGITVQMYNGYTALVVGAPPELNAWFREQGARRSREGWLFPDCEATWIHAALVKDGVPAALA